MTCGGLWSSSRQQEGSRFISNTDKTWTLKASWRGGRQWWTGRPSRRRRLATLHTSGTINGTQTEDKPRPAVLAARALLMHVIPVNLRRLQEVQKLGSFLPHFYLFLWVSSRRLVEPQLPHICSFLGASVSDRWCILISFTVSYTVNFPAAGNHRNESRGRRTRKKRKLWCGKEQWDDPGVKK